jgi:uncharacterized repeat protein (TIGR01451 family)
MEKYRDRKSIYLGTSAPLAVYIVVITVGMVLLKPLAIAPPSAAAQSTPGPWHGTVELKSTITASHQSSGIPDEFSSGTITYTDVQENVWTILPTTPPTGTVHVKHTRLMVSENLRTNRVCAIGETPFPIISYVLRETQTISGDFIANVASPVTDFSVQLATGQTTFAITSRISGAAGNVTQTKDQIQELPLPCLNAIPPISQVAQNAYAQNTRLASITGQTPSQSAIDQAIDQQQSVVLPLPLGFITTVTATGTQRVTGRVNLARTITTVDLSLAKSNAPDPVLVGSDLTYKLEARNHGPVASTGVTVTDTLPAGVELVSAAASQGTCNPTGPPTPTNRRVTCSIGSLANAATATVTIVVKVRAPGPIANAATVAAVEPDSQMANNLAESRTTAVRLQLKDVSFLGGHVIRADPGPTGTPAHNCPAPQVASDFCAPHWFDGNLDGDADDAGERRFPVAFSRGQKMRASANFQLSETLSVPIRIRADGPDLLDLPATLASVQGTAVSISSVESNTPFPVASGIQMFDPFAITWQASIDNGQTWADVGVSSNPLYVTLADPRPCVLAGCDRSLYHTLIHLSSMNAKGETTEGGAIAKIWSEFTDRSVKAVNREYPLTYYAAYTDRCTNTGDLLRDGDGQCGAWTSLFLSMLKAHGIERPGSYILVEARKPAGCEEGCEYGFLVKNWRFTLGNGSSGFPQYPYLNIPAIPLVFPGGNSYRWHSADWEDDLSGLPGQGNTNPASLFNNHQIAHIDGTYYDASYGRTYHSLSEMDQSVIAGYFRKQLWPVDAAKLGLDRNRGKVQWPAYLIRENPEGLDLVETRLIY